MMKYLTFLLLFPAVTGVAQPNDSGLLREKMASQIRRIADGMRGVAGILVVDITTGERFALNPSMQFPQGSAIKIPILMEVFRQAHEGRFSMNDLRQVERRFQVGGSGIMGEFLPHSSQLSIYDLCVLMIVLSDNSATNLLIDLVGMERVNATLLSLGCNATRLQRVMMDTQASASNRENLSTPEDAARIMMALYQGTFVSRTVSDSILDVLRKPKPGHIVAALPPGVPVAFKPGDIDGVDTEWAMVFLSGRPYIVIVMEKFGLGGEAHEAFRGIGVAAYDYFWRLARSSRYGTYVTPDSSH